MGVFICLGQSIHNANSAINYSYFSCIQQIHEYMTKHGSILLFLGEGTHKIKKKAEQIACNIAIQNFDTLLLESKVSP